MKNDPAITAEDIDRHVRYLASDDLKGRFTATPEARRAARYIADEFRRYGLKPVGEDGSYFQSFPFIAGVNCGEQNRLATTVNGQTRHWKVKDDFMPMAFSTEEQVEADVAFVGYGISAADIGYDDYAGLDVKGKLVLALRFSPEGDNPHSQFERHASFRAKALMARQHGARAIAFIADTDDFQSNKLSQMEFDYSFSDSDIVAIAISRPVANELISTTGASLDEVQKRINDNWTKDQRLSAEPAESADGLGSLPGVTVKIQVDLVKDTRQAANVVGFLEGNDPVLKDEVVVIGAHYDHLGLGGPNSLAPKQTGEVHNGADDNASGVAGLLELAQAFAAQTVKTSVVRGPWSKTDRPWSVVKDNATDEEQRTTDNGQRTTDNGRFLKRSLLFIAFSGEEEGLLGSNYYVKHPLFPLERTVAMINLDMIGRLQENKLIVQGLGTSPAWPALIEEVNRLSLFEGNPKFQIPNPKQIPNPQSQIQNSKGPGTRDQGPGTKFDLKTSADGAGPSDHASFYLKDIPVLFFFTGVHSDYHKPSDDVDKINTEGQARVVRFVYEAVSKIQGRRERPPFTKTSGSEQMGRRGFRVTLGVMPDYAESAEGLRISGTREGSPAERAGLKAGDIIIRLGSIRIKNIYDYTFALGELKAGEEVELEVLRAGQRVVVKIVPEKRSQ